MSPHRSEIDAGIGIISSEISTTFYTTEYVYAWVNNIGVLEFENIRNRTSVACCGLWRRVWLAVVFDVECGLLWWTHADTRFCGWCILLEHMVSFLFSAQVYNSINGQTSLLEVLLQRCAFVHFLPLVLDSLFPACSSCLPIVRKLIPVLVSFQAKYPQRSTQRSTPTPELHRKYFGCCRLLFN